MGLDQLNLPPLRSSILVEGPRITLPSPAEIHAVMPPPASPDGGSVAGSRRPSVAGSRRPSVAGGSRRPSISGSVTGADKDTDAWKQRRASGVANINLGSVPEEEEKLPPDAAAMLTARKMGVGKRVEESEGMTRYRAEQARVYAAAMRSAERVNLGSTRALGLLCKLRDGHASGVTALQYVDDGNLLASGAADGLILVWNLEEQRYERVMDNHTTAVTSLCWHPDTKKNVLASSSADATVKVWDVDTGMPLITIRDHGRYSVSCAVYSSDGDMLATAGASKYVFLYNMQRMAGNWAAAKRSSKDMMITVIKPRDAGNPDGHAGRIARVAWAAGNDRIASASDDGTVRVWNIPHGGRFLAVCEGHEGGVTDVGWDAAAERLLSAGADGSVRTWDATDGRPLRVMAGQHRGAVAAALFTPEGGGRRIVSAGKTDRQIVLWESATGLPMQVLEGLHEGVIHCLAGRPDGLHVATGSGDKSIGVWRVLAPGCCEYIGWQLYSAFGCCCGEDEAADASLPPEGAVSGAGKRTPRHSAGSDGSADAGGDAGPSWRGRRHGRRGRGSGTEGQEDDGGSVASDGDGDGGASKRMSGLAALRRHNARGAAAVAPAPVLEAEDEDAETVEEEEGGGAGHRGDECSDADSDGDGAGGGSSSSSPLKHGAGGERGGGGGRGRQGAAGGSPAKPRQPRSRDYAGEAMHGSHSSGGDARSAGAGSGGGAGRGTTTAMVTDEAVSARIGARSIINDAARAARSQRNANR